MDLNKVYQVLDFLWEMFKNNNLNKFIKSIKNGKNKKLDTCKVGIISKMKVNHTILGNEALKIFKISKLMKVTRTF